MDKWLYRAMMTFVVVGLMVSIYMTVYKLTSNESMCLGSGDCSTVNASRYSEVNGIPVAVLGVIGYASILAALWVEKANAFLRNNSTLLVFGISLTGFLFTVWLIYVEVVLVKALCPFCITSQVSMTLIFILAIIRMTRQPQS